MQKLAVLIESKYIKTLEIERILEKVKTFGDATVVNIYGDLINKDRYWMEEMSELGIKPIQNRCFDITSKASYEAIMVDAMDLLHTGRFDGFVIASKESEFFGLVMRLKEQGLSVYGFGVEKVSAVYAKTFSKFVFMENFSEERKILHPAPIFPDLD